MRKFKIGIAGCGRAGWLMHCKELDARQENFEIVSVCDIDTERCQEFQQRYPGTSAYTDFNEFVKDPSVEVVSIVVPSIFHVEYTRIALEAGKIVYLEKPIALNEAECDELERLDTLYPGKIFVRHNRRFESAFTHIREILQTGILGEILEVRLCRHRFQMRNDWQTISDLGGGQLNNWGPHLIDHALRFLDSPVKNVYSALRRVNCEGDAEDHVKFILEGENGRIVDVEISDAALLSGDVYFIIGTRGTLRCSDEKNIEIKSLPQDFVLPEKHPHPESLPRNVGYGNTGNIEFVTQNIPVAPSNNSNMGTAYTHLYNALAGIAEYPVSMAQALANCRTGLLIRKKASMKLF